MSAIAGKSLETRSSVLRSIALGGSIIFVVQLIIQSWFVASILQQNPFIVVLQYIASGALGESAFAGGTATALLGVLFHYMISFVIAGVFILSADRIHLLRRFPFVFSLLYGFGVFIVMNLIVLPLSAAPTLPAPPIGLLIEIILEHILLIGLPLGILVQRNANADK